MVIEVELSPEKRRHVVDDFFKLRDADADAIWVVKDAGGMRKLLSSLTGQLGYIEARKSDNFEKISDELDADGAQKIFGINKLRKDLGDD